MQLKILITLVFLIITLHSNAYSKNMKNKYISQLNAKTEKKITSLSKSNTNKKSEANKNTENSEQILYNEKLNFNYAQTFALFKQISKNLFIEKQPGMLDHCIDLVSNHLTYQEPVFKSFWQKMGDIYEEQQIKSRMESNPTSPNHQIGSLNKLNDWKNTLLGEYQNIIKYVDFEQSLKSECAKLFSDTSRNVFDLLFVLSETRFFGGRNILVNKNDQFIDSMFSVHRNRLPENSFKKLNEVSADYMQFNNDQLRSIMGKRSYVPRSGSGKKLSPYASDIKIDFSKIIVRYKIKYFCI
jgi:hypothetical protein